MGNRFASGKFSIAECDRCGQQYKLKQLKTENKSLQKLLKEREKVFYQKL